MVVVRTNGTFFAIRAFSPPSSSISHAPGHATCGSPAWIGKGLTCVCFKRKGNCQRICISLTPLQEERLRRLKRRMKVYFDASKLDHQEALRALWSTSFPGQELHGLISDQWKEMGWQGRDPSTDFRGAGYISLENLLFFAKTFSTSFQCLLKKQGGKGAVWEYPFAVAGVNITFMIMQMLDLDATKPRTFVRTVFLQMLSECFKILSLMAFTRGFKVISYHFFRILIHLQKMSGHLTYFIVWHSWLWTNNGWREMLHIWNLMMS